jgi:Uncharacterized protein with SCP/PR1 domains
MKLLRKIISLILVFILGFWFAFAGILDGTKAGDVLITIVSYLPDRNDIHNILDEPTQDQSRQIDSDSEEVTEPPTLQVDFESEDNEVNYELVEATIIELTNELRQEQGLSTLVPNDMLRAAAYIRAEELEETFFTHASKRFRRFHRFSRRGNCLSLSHGWREFSHGHLLFTRSGNGSILI